MATMSFYNKNLDPVFQGVGTKVGLEIWCIKNLQLVPVPKISHGKFYSGNAYLVLNTFLLKDETSQHEIHYWLGSEANEVDSTLASDKALELDMALGSCTVQYKEIQGQETVKFLSYFKPCIIPIEGDFTSEPDESSNGAYRACLLACKGDHAVSVKEVPFSRSSLNHDDVFILDTASKIFLFSGCNSSTQERAKALEVVKYIKDDKHNGNCKIATIEDGKFVGDSDAGEFWSLFGGYAPIPKDSPSFFQRKQDPASIKLFWITLQGELSEVLADSLHRQLLSNDKCYMLDCESEVYVWMGRGTSTSERKKAISTAEGFLRSQDRSTVSHLTVLTERLETPKFRSYFVDWSQLERTTLYEEGREKVAAMFKQKGYAVKEIPEEECSPSIDCSGTLKVWLVNGNEIHVIPAETEIKLFSGDCYIIQYTYPGSESNEHIFYSWLGRASVMEDRLDTLSQMISMANSIKGALVLAQIMEGKEPEQFFWIMQRLIIFKGGMSERYKSYIAENGIQDQTYNGTKMALFRVQGTSPDNVQAIEVDPVSSALNSFYCFILQTETIVYTWIGNLTSSRDHDLLDRMLELLNPSWQSLSLREGGEPEDFWKAVGGKAEYPREKESKSYIEDPRLLLCRTITEGDLKVKEIFNFGQDDLTTEDIFILDCNTEVFVWIGSHSNVQSKDLALKLGQKYLEADLLAQGQSSETPLYIVTEGHEPEFFTRFFAWDSSKTKIHGNSFERKLALLKGEKHKMEGSPRNSWSGYQSGHTQNGSRSRSVSSTGTPRSVSPASSVSEMQFSRRFSSPAPVTKKLFLAESPSYHPDSSNRILPSSMTEETREAGAMQEDNLEHVDSIILPYEQLKLGSSDSATGIDITKREAYLSEEEFQEKFGMTKKAFYRLPKWKQNKLKVSVYLF